MAVPHLPQKTYGHLTKLLYAMISEKHDIDANVRHHATVVTPTSVANSSVVSASAIPSGTVSRQEKPLALNVSSSGQHLVATVSTISYASFTAARLSIPTWRDLKLINNVECFEVLKQECVKL